MSVTFRQAGAGDVPALNAALARLSADIGDTHRASDEDLRRAGFGAHPAFRAVLAETAEGLVGVALYSPAMSTSKGLVVTYVADLWISPDLRGQRLGPRLLAAVARDAAETWGARALKLNVYHASPDARRFYDRLGFVAATQHTEMFLDEARTADLATHGEKA
ncbi:MAG: N-acetyltransferase [Rhodobacteraceae bacterium]|jgi:GNAT superfamily N-acetyltransferase|uniref:Acetyltransferase (GNAT) family protein n=1 Tax=Salipiger profundus TaxID=1229727 RepID=A0A1U7D7Z0_9RHOB|nr:MULTISPECIES: GNAT family N-acetyltransferase [Salipiger]APX24243.1 acetyltransferase (GNAT) family protein [Salipiger profundus]MAB07430.1 N-acetyltransferase [Paracoccaceae bacterium]GFZ95523.1 putative acetyltransferase [Salipiger profundus]SFB86579.1 Acetyltransferase (GNAT) family protein [Salipiger profundus]